MTERVVLSEPLTEVDCDYEGTHRPTYTNSSNATNHLMVSPYALNCGGLEIRKLLTTESG